MYILFLIVFLVLLLFDQWSKNWALIHLSDYASASGVPKSILDEPVRVLPHVFEFNYDSNEAGAMGITFPWARIVLIVATFVLLIALSIYIYKRKVKSPVFLSAAALLYAGGIGNLIDRICRGYVPDFIQFAHNKYFPYIFNVADIWVCIGAVVLGVYILCTDEKRGREKDAGDL